MLESKIDDLYRKALDEFIPARTALAAELKGDDAKRVKALKKPTIVPWAVNQVYWHARPIFDHVQRSGADLRRAQIAALEGRKADVHGAADAHRKAIATAVDRAMTLAGAVQMNPHRDAVARTFEALSLTSAPQESPGRLTQPLQPGGFELLAGVEPVMRSTPMKGVPDTPVSRATPIKGVLSTDREGRPHAHRVGDGRKTTPRVGDGLETVPTSGSKPAAKIDTRRAAEERAAAAQRAAAERKRERAHAAAVRKHEAAVAKLEGELERARKEAVRARVAWDRATDEVNAAERRLSEVRATRPPSLFSRT